MSARALALLLVLALLAVSLVDAPWPKEQGLQQLGTVGGVALYVVAWRRWSASTTALLLFALFLALHVVGARWIYSYVPYDDACEALFGARIGEHLGWTRNYYDRFVNAAYGVLALPLFAEGLRRELGTGARAERWLATARGLAKNKAVVAQPTLHEGGTKTGTALVSTAPAGADLSLARWKSILERTSDAAAEYGAP